MGVVISISLAINIVLLWLISVSNLEPTLSSIELRERIKEPLSGGDYRWDDASGAELSLSGDPSLSGMDSAMVPLASFYNDRYRISETGELSGIIAEQFQFDESTVKAVNNVLRRAVGQIVEAEHSAVSKEKDNGGDVVAIYHVQAIDLQPILQSLRSDLKAIVKEELASAISLLFLTSRTVLTSQRNRTYTVQRLTEEGVFVKGVWNDDIQGPPPSGIFIDAEVIRQETVPSIRRFQRYGKVLEIEELVQKWKKQFINE